MVDHNNNTITLTYDANSNRITITDASGRTLTLAYDSYGKVGSIADPLGTVATYVHASFGRLSSVTYPDGSKFTFTTVFSENNMYVGTVKDALNNVIESHTYDTQGRALTSEIADNGTERYTLSYVSGTETDVTDALSRVTKYFYNAANANYQYDVLNRLTQLTDSASLNFHKGTISLGCVTVDKNDPSAMRHFDQIKNILNGDRRAVSHR